MARREYPPECRQQIIELHRAGRRLAELAREFELGEQTIRFRIKQAEVDEGQREELTTEEREELRRLRRENRQLKLGRDPEKSRGLVCSGERVDPAEGFQFMSWYNRRRRHSGLGQMSPINYEKHSQAA